jgi:hypothetical protein
MLDDTDKYIKDNLQNIIDGKFDDKFEPDQLKMMLEMSFLYNHISFEDDSVIFEHGTNKIKIDSISSIPTLYLKETIVSQLKSEEAFKSSIKEFLRDKKINDLLK